MVLMRYTLGKPYDVMCVFQVLRCHHSDSSRVARVKAIKHQTVTTGRQWQQYRSALVNSVIVPAVIYDALQQLSMQR